MQEAGIESEIPIFPLAGKTTARLFFAIWPDAAVRDRLDEAARALHQACGGRLTRAATIHLTLAFLGEVALDQVEILKALAGQIQFPSFEMGVVQFGWWRRKRIVWAAPEPVPEPLKTLAETLQARLDAAGFVVDSRPYAPHVTLVRKAGCKQMEFLAQAIGWKVDEFVLVRSVTDDKGANYEVIGRWPLQR